MGGGQGHVRRAIANTRTRAKEHDSYVFAQTREHVLAMVCIGYVVAMFWVGPQQLAFCNPGLVGMVCIFPIFFDWYTPGCISVYAISSPSSFKTCVSMSMIFCAMSTSLNSSDDVNENAKNKDDGRRRRRHSDALPVVIRRRWAPR